jgi:hypothetical protein
LTAAIATAQISRGNNKQKKLTQNSQTRDLAVYDYIQAIWRHTMWIANDLHHPYRIPALSFFLILVGHCTSDLHDDAHDTVQADWYTTQGAE